MIDKCRLKQTYDIWQSYK